MNENENNIFFFLIISKSTCAHIFALSSNFSEQTVQKKTLKREKRKEKNNRREKELKNNFIEMWSSKTTTITSPVIYQSIFR